HLGHATSDFPNQLFINDGQGQFKDIAQMAGVTNDRFCKGVATGDYDNDGDLDLYVSNAGANRLYRNDGSLKFTDVAEALGVAEPSGRSFATWFFDYNNDGWLDLFVAGYKANPADLLADYRGEPHAAIFPKLFQNTGDGRFKDVTRAVGLEHVYLPMGANFGDVDFDGWLDIYLATGDPKYETLMPNVLLRNVEGQGFANATTSAGLGHLQKGHGVAFVDLDDDGDQDLYHQLGGFYPGDKFHNALFLNPGNDHHHLYVQLRGTKTNRDAIGAKITVKVRTNSGPRQIHRWVGMVSSFGGSPLRQEIGLGQAEAIEEVIVEWPVSGTITRLFNVALDSKITVTE
ncbi:MAG: CRTAC1 family protein, partial [Verrucomicrobiales bacterium]